mmetsp:Transcript_58235/g.161447  ORF Transcript_58235/g.161447 Transcript_58235/m.161447 type:complete len:238 (+) Transcript_58235:318-1031(+)
MSVFTDAQEEFSSNYPQIAKYGWGPSTKAERWNGRHAMFGWVVIIGTLYAQAHHLIPNPTETLNLKEWGTLATISGKETLTQERAIILIAHVHALFVSLCSAWLPLNYMDSLLLDADSGEVDEPAIGLFPKFSTGITMGAEIMNGRMVRCITRQTSRGRRGPRAAKRRQTRPNATRARARHALHPTYHVPHARIHACVRAHTHTTCTHALPPALMLSCSPAHMLARSSRATHLTDRP